MIDALALELHRIGALKFGSFKLKSGLISPFYIDLRLLVSYPEILEMVADNLYQLTQAVNYQRLAAIPYAALPIGVAMALRTRKPLVYMRKERKTYGTGQMIEGEYAPGETILLVDDVITNGDSKLEHIEQFRAAGLRLTDIAVLIDREGGGAQSLAAQGCRLHQLWTVRQLVDILCDAGRIGQSERQQVNDWVEAQA